MEVVLNPEIPPGLVAVAAVLACAVVTAWLMGVAWAKGRMASEGAGPAPAPETSAAPAAQDDAACEASAMVARPAAATAACQQRAIEERRAVFARPVALAELHAEVAAIRRDEEIFRDAWLDDSLLVLRRVDGAAGCRFLGLSGQPTCPSTSGGACREGRACPGFAQHDDAPGPRPANANRISAGRC